VKSSLWRRRVSEFVGTGLLVAVVVGSGIAAQQLSPHDVGLQLLENSLATALGLTVLILIFGPVSGGHFNPVISLADWVIGRRSAPDCLSARHPSTWSPRSPAASAAASWRI
jgi:arsenate reductase